MDGKKGAKWKFVVSDTWIDERASHVDLIYCIELWYCTIRLSNLALIFQNQSPRPQVIWDNLTRVFNTSSMKGLSHNLSRVKQQTTQLAEAFYKPPTATQQPYENVKRHTK
jgi:hypothetical protein